MSSISIFSKTQGLFTQILMTGAAIGIVVLYVQPTIAKIGDMQDDIVVYQEERKKVDEVNNELSRFIDQLEAVSSADRQKLAVFIPDTVDTIAVPRILRTITGESGMLFRDFSYDEIEQDHIGRALDSGRIDFAIPHAFSFSVEGTYGQLKNLLTLLEQNEYPLEVHGLDIAADESGFLSVSLKIITYAHTVQAESVFSELDN